MANEQYDDQGKPDFDASMGGSKESKGAEGAAISGDAQDGTPKANNTRGQGLGAKALEGAEKGDDFGDNYVKAIEDFGNGETAALSKLVGATAGALPGGAFTAKLLQAFIKGRHAKRNSGALGLGIVGIATAAMLFATGGNQSLAWVKIATDMGSLFSNSERASDDRLGKTFQYARTGGPERSRLSLLGNKIADAYEKKMRAGGVTLNYDGGTTGRLRSITIDTKTNGGKQAVERLKQQGYPSAETKPDSNGRVTVDLSENGGFGNTARRRVALSGMIGVLDMNKVSNAMAARVLKARGGVDFHPLKNAVRSADENFDEWKKKRKAERAQSIETGEPIPDPRTEYAVDEDGNPVDANGNPIDDNAATNAKNDIQKGISDANSLDGSNEAKGLAVRGAGVTAVVGAVCGVYDAGEQIKASKWIKIVQPLIRFGMSLLIIGNQIKTGQDVTPDELSVVNDTLVDQGRDDDPKTTDIDETRPATSFDQAAAYRGVQGEDVSKSLDRIDDKNSDNSVITGYDMPVNARPGAANALPAGLGFVNGLVNKWGGAPVCNFVNSTAGGLITAGIGLVITGVPGVGQAAAIASSVASAAIMGAVSNMIIGWMSGSVLDVGHVAGAPAGNYLAYGVRLAANENEIARGGSALSRKQSGLLAVRSQEAEQAVLANQSTYEKYLNPSNTNSALARAAFAMRGSTAGDATQRVASLLSFNPITDIVSNFTTRTSAASTYDFGFPEYGFSADILDSSELDDPYANADYVEPRLAEFNERYGEKCFGITIDPDTKVISNTLEAGATMDYRTIDNSDPNIGCPVKSTDVEDTVAANKDGVPVISLASTSQPAITTAASVEATSPTSDYNRYRMYLLDLKTAVAAACYEGVDDNACVEIGMSDPVSEASPVDTGQGAGGMTKEELVQPSESIACAEGTQDQGIETGYYASRPIKIRLCGIPGLATASGSLASVNSRVSGVWLTLAQKMETDNHSVLATSSWRSMETQRMLYADNPANAAVPGTSNHQLGLAVDLQILPSQVSRGRLSEPWADPSGHWAWLNTNARPLGLASLSDEFWHWEPAVMEVD